jgi:hypothetical protein
MIVKAKDLKRGMVVYMVFSERVFVVTEIKLPPLYWNFGNTRIQSFRVFIFGYFQGKNKKDIFSFEETDLIPVIGQSTEVF